MGVVNFWTAIQTKISNSTPKKKKASILLAFFNLKKIRGENVMLREYLPWYHPSRRNN